MKVAPGVLSGWFLGRLGRERGSEEGRGAAIVLGSAAVVGLAVLGLSLVAGGAQLWRDYIPVAGAASRAQLLDPRNVGPAAQIALAVGGDEALVRALQIPIAIGAVVASLAAGALLRDRLLGMTIAAVASLVILPITWYHYPVALMPFAVAAIARVRGQPRRLARRRARRRGHGRRVALDRLGPGRLDRGRAARRAASTVAGSARTTARIARRPRPRPRPPPGGLPDRVPDRVHRELLGRDERRPERHRPVPARRDRGRPRSVVPRRPRRGPDARRAGRLRDPRRTPRSALDAAAARR